MGEREHKLVVELAGGVERMKPDARDDTGATPLHLAALHGHDSVAKILLDNGAPANAVDADGRTPLQAAESRQKPQVVQLLRSHGADIAEAVAEDRAHKHHGALAEESSAHAVEQLRSAVQQLDSKTVSRLLASGLEMDEETTNEAFWAVVKAVDLAEEKDEPLPADMPVMLHHIFDADRLHLLRRDKITVNVTCMQPAGEGVEGVAESLTYVFDDSAHADLSLKEGRRCEGGSCCDACSRNQFPTFATSHETDLETFPELAGFTFNDLETVSAATILQFARLVERVRRTIAHEYGLPLGTVLPLQAYSRKYVAGMTQQGGGGGEGDFVILHTDEATHSGYHYSCVIYLSTQGEDFEGGDFVFNDPDPDAETKREPAQQGRRESMFAMGVAEEGELSLAEQLAANNRAGRLITPFHPQRGAAVIFSSGWENMHEVEPLTSGTRYAVPCFFTTCPVPDIAYEQMGAGKPASDEDIADDWLHLLLAHRAENPLESTGRVKELLMKWHYMCTPLHQHG